MKSLKEFMESKLSNVWIENSEMKVYVRKGKHYHDGEIINTLDIANIEVQCGLQGQGIFSRFLNHAESYGLPVHIENVLTEQFANFFRKREGYEAFNEVCGMVSFIKG